MTSVYKQILKDSWQLTKHNRWLWFFGLFAALLGNGGIFNILIKNITSVQDQGGIVTDLNTIFTQGAVGALLASAREIFINLNTVSVLSLLVIVLLAVFLLWLATVTQGGLISGLFRLSKQQPTDFKESWERGIAKFWPVLGLNISTQVVTYVLLLVLGLPFALLYFTTQNLVWQWVFLVISYMIFVPLAIIIASIVQFAVMYVVIKNDSFWASVKEGWNLFKKNWIVSIEMALVLFVINILAGFALIIASTFLMLPFMLLGFIAVYLAYAGLFNFAFVLGIIVLIVVVSLFGAVFATFQIAAWVILFTKLTEDRVVPKILRLAAAWAAKRAAN